MIKDLQDIIKNKDEKISDLYNELNNIKNEKNDYELNLSKQYYFNINILKDEKNKNNLLQNELNKKDNELKKICAKLENLQKIVDENYETINDLTEKNNILFQQIEKMKNVEAENNDYDREEIEKELDHLRNLVKKFEDDTNLKDLTNEKIIKKIEQKNNDKINQLQKELEDEKSRQINYIESTQLKDNNINININNDNDNDNNITQKEEKKIIKYEPNSNIFKIEYENIKEKYNLLLNEQKNKERNIKNKEEEVNYLNKYLKDMIKEQKEKKMYYKELKYKYKNLLNKKEKYKELCKIAKKNLEIIIGLLNPEQKKQIEKSERKYLIDTDSFSFTEA